MGVKIEVNNRIVSVKKGDTILSALRSHGIEIPSICSMKDLTPAGACRMCVVEVEGVNNLVPSCSVPVSEGMKIKTHSSRVIESRKSIVELLLSNHPDDCLYCERNGTCELQKLSEELNIKERRIFGKKNRSKIDNSSPVIVRDLAKCVLCGRCVRVCDEKMSVHAIDFLNRGNQSVIGTTFNKEINFSTCISCGQCLLVCPTGALIEKNCIQDVVNALHDKSKLAVVQYDHSVSVSLAEEFGIKPGKDISRIINGALRKIGFNLVFDIGLGSDISTLDISTEIVSANNEKRGVPVISSNCPAWVKFAENRYPELTSMLSQSKSPAQIMASVIKNQDLFLKDSDCKSLFLVSISSCTAQKYEVTRPDLSHKGVSEIDSVLTTRELAKLIKLFGIGLDLVDDELIDEPFRVASSSAKLYSVAGGMSEAVLRSIQGSKEGKEQSNYKFPELRSGKSIKEAEIKIGKTNYKIVSVCGIPNSLKILDELKEGNCEYDFIEIMACEGGCINGGGQPLGADEASLKLRSKAIYCHDDVESIRSANRNIMACEIYKELKPIIRKKSLV